MHQLPAALAAMAAYRQFIVCQLVPDPDHPGKTFKYPLNIYDGKKHDAHDPAIWLDAATACAVVTSWGASYCVGFTFTEQDPFWFIDVDNCLDAATGQWTPIVAELSAALPGAACEVSQSGRGLHFFGTGTAPAERRKKDYTNKLFDLYTEKRFVALTGHGIVGNIATEHTPALYALTEKWLKRVTTSDGRDAEWTYGPCEGWNGPADDAQLIKRAMQSQSARGAFGGAASFADLWECNEEALAKAYPPDGNGKAAWDMSRADRALAQHLMFWTGKDCERTRRLMMQSGLVREKWERESYVLATILSAFAVQQSDQVLADKPPEPAPMLAAPLPVSEDPDAEAAPVAKYVTGSTYLDPAQQISMFTGCTYVCDKHAVLTPGGYLLKPEQFRVMYGGYTFLMDLENARTSRDAWEAFSQSQAYRSPRADSVCFRPDRAPGALIDYDGQKRANLWWPVDTPRMAGDAAPFLNHLAALLPDERDRTILLSYMAAVVQYPGIKFQWAPFIQGAEGNGKTFLTRCVARAVGSRYTYFPKASDIADKFNDWLYGTIFVAVEDIYIPGGRDEVMEELKPMITGDEQQVQGKGEKKVSREICCNFMINSNHKDGWRKHKNDRRIAPFFTAQQTADDVAEWGMTGEYFERLYAWARGGGFAIVNEYLRAYQIPDEFNPATRCQRAPLTSSTEEAISAGLGSVEQEILEAVEQDQPGFAGGWISSMALNRLLEQMGRANRVPINKRRELLAKIGYDWHPGLATNNGRVNNQVAPDGGKPVLFAKIGHPVTRIMGPAEIAKAYSEAQMAPLLKTVS
jgi:hypothetical protein